MIDWFQRTADECRLDSSTAEELDVNGFAVIDGPVIPAGMDALTLAYDRVVGETIGADKSVGRTTTRVHDLVNRGAEFDCLYVHGPALAASFHVVRRPFKLSNLLARTLHPRSGAQTWHTDVVPGQDGWPMLGFILMLDRFTAENGATRFLRGSHTHAMDARSVLESDLVPACGDRGCMVVYHGAVVHGHGSNATDRPRRSIQGAYIPRDAQGFGLAERMTTDTRARIGGLAEYLIAS